MRNTRTIAALLAPALIQLAAPAAALAQRSPAGDPPPAAIDSIFARYDHTNTPGCALGVYRDERLAYGRGYGMAELNQGVPIGTGTVFYIASTSKQFTAASIALLAEEGKLSLADPVRKWIPELPAYAQPITIANLVHHTSGIRDYLGLWAMSGRSIADEVPPEMALDLVARQRALDFAPGSRYSYSNSGYLLLAEIVKRASGKSLREFTTERIFAPLGMTSTQFHDDNTRIVARRAEGYQPDGRGGFRIVRTSFALVGDGGLLTSVDDLIKWDANFYHNRLGKGDPALIAQLVTPEPTPLASGKPQVYAFGLMPGSYRGLPIVEHGGAFIGFRAQLLRFPQERLSVAILCNDYTAQPEAMARQVADRYLGARFAAVAAASVAPPAASTAGATPAADVLERWVGRYEVLPGIVAAIVRDGSTLTMTLMGQRLLLRATSDSTFITPTSSEPATFARTSSGVTLQVPQFDMSAPAPRLVAIDTLAPAAAAAYAGRYASAELDTWGIVRSEGSALQLRLRYGEWMVLEPLARDVFTVRGAGARLAFTRDARGAVRGFSLSAARTQNLVFERER
ncbi:MAG: beta-lactamase family protein [Gemmatimonadaceae bacterium]|nr:beta-lactamase family protein [Gemmatimonadaceae bacterium]